jgi:hypothetical protein
MAKKDVDLTRLQESIAYAIVSFRALASTLREAKRILVVVDSFSRVANSIPIGYECPHCSRRSGKSEYCTSCGADFVLRTPPDCAIISSLD